MKLDFSIFLYIRFDTYFPNKVEKKIKKYFSYNFETLHFFFLTLVFLGNRLAYGAQVSLTAAFNVIATSTKPKTREKGICVCIYI